MNFLTKFFKVIFDFFVAIWKGIASLFTSFSKIVAWFASNLTTILVFAFLGFVLFLLYQVLNKTEGLN